MIHGVNIVLGTWGRKRLDADAGTVYLDLRNNTVQRAGVIVALTPHVMRVATMLLCARWRVSARELVGAVYNDRQNGGPLHARGTVIQFMRRLRNALACLGVAFTKGYGSVGYGVTVSAMPASNVVQFQPRAAVLSVVGGELASVA